MADLLVSATALMAAVLLIRLFLGGRLSAGVRYALWLVVLVRLLIPFHLFSSPVSVLNTMPQRAVPQSGATTAAWEPPAAEPAAGPDVRVLPPPTPRAVGPDRAAADLLPAVYVAGAAAVGLFFLASNLRFALRLRRERRFLDRMGGVAVYRADFLRSPCLAGLLRPAVYLPAGVEEARLGHVLAHELSHRRHGDNWWALLRCAALCLWWFHPLVWVSAVLSRRDCELCCDAAALRRLGEEERIPYGETLLALASGRGAGELLMASTAMTAGKGELTARILQIAKKPKVAWGVLALALVLAGGALLCTFTGRQEVRTEPPPAEETSVPVAVPPGDEGRKSDYYTFLLLGKSDVGTIDTVIAASYDGGTGAILSLVSIPRYLCVDDQGRCLSALSLQTPEDIRQKLEAQLGIPFDHYVQVDRAGLAAIVDALGGVEFDVPKDMDYDDPAQNLSIHLKKGAQHLTGEQAVMAAQYRMGNLGGGYADGDLGRAGTQRELLAALAEKAASLDSLRELVRLAEAAARVSDTDLTPQELAWLASSIKRQGDRFAVRGALLPGGSGSVWNETYQTKLSVYVADPEATLDMVNQMLNPYQAPRTQADLALAQPPDA